DRTGDPDRSGGARPAAPEPVRRPRASRPREDMSKVPRKKAIGALLERDGSGRGSGTFPERRADSRPDAGAGGAGLALGQAAPGHDSALSYPPPCTGHGGRDLGGK